MHENLDRSARTTLWLNLACGIIWVSVGTYGAKYAYENEWLYSGIGALGALVFISIFILVGMYVIFCSALHLTRKSEEDDE